MSAEAATQPWPFGELRPETYRTVLADPPWRFFNRSAAGEAKNAVSHYACMTEAQLGRLPVYRLAHPEGCALILWATAPLLPQALRTMAFWGFTFKSAGAWAKRSPRDTSWAFGTGYLLRSAAEFWLLGTRGTPAQQSRGVRNLIVSPVRGHSHKPPEMHLLAETLWQPPRCELFARARARGWDCWGAEIPPLPPPAPEGVGEMDAPLEGR